MSAMLLATLSASAQVPSGRWDGTVTFGALKVPFTMFFEGSAQALKGSLVNGDEKVSSTSGSLANGVLRLTFGATGTRLEGSLADGQFKGSYGSEKQGMFPVTAGAYCTCSNDGEAGPEVMGMWEVPGAGWKLNVRRQGDDTLVTVSRPSGKFGPLFGRFDGVSFMLHYFDGTRAALLEMEPEKDNGLALIWKAPNEDVQKFRAVRSN